MLAEVIQKAVYDIFSRQILTIAFKKSKPIATLEHKGKDELEHFQAREAK
jgi:hypothetical protein